MIAFAALGPFGDAFDFIFHERQSQAGTVRIGGSVDEHVTHTIEMFQHRHFGFARDALDQALAAARHDHVDVPFHRDEPAHRRHAWPAPPLTPSSPRSAGLTPSLRAAAGAGSLPSTPPAALPTPHRDPT